MTNYQVYSVVSPCINHLQVQWLLATFIHVEMRFHFFENRSHKIYFVRVHLGNIEFSVLLSLVK